MYLSKFYTQRGAQTHIPRPRVMCPTAWACWTALDLLKWYAKFCEDVYFFNFFRNVYAFDQILQGGCDPQLKNKSSTKMSLEPWAADTISQTGACLAQLSFCSRNALIGGDGPSEKQE